MSTKYDRLTPWQKSNCLIDPKIEIVRAQIDSSRSKLVVGGFNYQLELRAKLTVAIVDCIIEHIASIGP